MSLASHGHMGYSNTSHETHLPSETVNKLFLKNNKHRNKTTNRK